MVETDTITREEFVAFKKAVIKKLKFLEGLIDDAFQAINDCKASTTELTDEALEHSARAERAVRRLKKAFDDHEHEDI